MVVGVRRRIALGWRNWLLVTLVVSAGSGLLLLRAWSGGRVWITAPLVAVVMPVVMVTAVRSGRAAMARKGEVARFRFDTVDRQRLGLVWREQRRWRVLSRIATVRRSGSGLLMEHEGMTIELEADGLRVTLLVTRAGRVVGVMLHGVGFTLTRSAFGRIESQGDRAR